MLRETWLIPKGDMTWLYVRHDSLRDDVAEGMLRDMADS